MKYIYLCLIISAFSCSANEKKKGDGNNGGKIVDMGSDTFNPKSDTSFVDASTSDSGSKTDTNTTEDLGPTPDVGPGNRAPEIVDIFVSPASITEGESFTVRVEIEDPDGADDIVDARLKDSDQNSYGDFDNDGGGSYSKTISWRQINSIRPITFATRDSISFLAVFADSAANSVKRNISGTLDCNGGVAACEGSCGLDLCAGACRNLESDANHCGQCSKTCERGCTDGACDAAPGQNENYGELCRVNSDCSDSSCVTITSPIFAGDVCAKPCTLDSQCNGDAICLDLTPLQLGQYCANRCGPGDTCPNGMNCQNLGNNSNVCAPF